MQKWSSKSESTQKTKQNRSCWKILTMVKVNGQRMTYADVAVWRHLRAYVAEREAQQARDAHGWAWDLRVRRVELVLARQKLQPTRGGACDAVSGRSWLGFCSGLAVLSFYAFSLTVEWAKRWYPRVASTVGVTAVARFWQWLLDEGKGSGRTPEMSEMSVGTRKSEEWLWYHVNNIKWERNTE